MVNELACGLGRLDAFRRRATNEMHYVVVGSESIQRTWVGEIFDIVAAVKAGGAPTSPDAPPAPEAAGPHVPE